MQKITPCLWFDSQAEDAARFYTARVMAALLKMTKIDIETLKRASREGGTVPLHFRSGLLRPRAPKTRSSS